MSVRDDNQAHIEALADQLLKVKAEFVNAIQTLKDQYQVGDALDFKRLDELVASLNVVTVPVDVKSDETSK